MIRPREEMRDRIGKFAACDLPESGLDLGCDAPITLAKHASDALAMVVQAAEVIRNTRSQAMAADARIEAAEVARRAAEHGFREIKARLKATEMEAQARIKSAEATRDAAVDDLEKIKAQLKAAKEELSQTRSWVATTNMELTTAAQRVRAAEARASEAEKAVCEIEHAIRVELVGPAMDMSNGSNGAYHSRPGGTFMPEYPSVAH
jgi:DNA repair exonuclease SbcCD ATPase subunit